MHAQGRSRQTEPSSEDGSIGSKPEFPTLHPPKGPARRFAHIQTMAAVPASPPSKAPLTEEEQLRADLRIEKRKTAALQREVERLKKQLITTSAESEAEEEAIQSDASSASCSLLLPRRPRLPLDAQRRWRRWRRWRRRWWWRRRRR